MPPAKVIIASASEQHIILDSPITSSISSLDTEMVDDDNDALSDLDIILSDEDADDDEVNDDKENETPADYVVDDELDDEVDMIAHSAPTSPSLDLPMTDIPFDYESGYESDESGTSTVTKASITASVVESVDGDRDRDPGNTARFRFEDMKYSIAIEAPQYMLPPQAPLRKSFAATESTFFFTELGLPGGGTLRKSLRQSSIGDHVPLGHGFLRSATVGTPQRSRVVREVETPASPSKRSRVVYEVESPESPSKRRRAAYDVQPPASPTKRRRATFDRETLSSALKRKRIPTDDADARSSTAERGRKRRPGEQLITPPTSSHTSPARVVPTPSTSPVRSLRMGFSTTAPAATVTPQKNWRVQDNGDTPTVDSTPFAAKTILRSGRTADQEMMYLINNSGFNTSFRERIEKAYPKRKQAWRDQSMPVLGRNGEVKSEFRVFEDATATPPKKMTYFNYRA